MKLIGSKPSPYVRRLRLWLAAEDYDYVQLDILGPEGREALRQHTPAMKIPVLIDSEHTVYDSRVIYEYLNQKLKKERLSWEQQNTLTLIDAVNDSFVIMIMMDRSCIDNSQDILIANLQRDRIEQTLSILEQKCQGGEFSQWQYPAICLYCLLDWIEFRELYELGAYPALQAFKQASEAQPMVNDTDPRV
ncbi:glutathione S-transferase family protein [Pseudoteredinibacter isoporae]|uniref:Glutathione S-transferase n=1 Tax=Pseudoteredinibacter isoporae TaxID=570281 RepID=A0A7X0JRZ2_9GAMM|nr:glutathione S-transferase family protein [Pseudoteredinibacter isoporae]MBB6520256.1 glutathione S-transferase [Pseudoteredinibacter isoporae]NHO85828.1 glutathione S-transferase family protein [Pseudoteredinibacter isoporae]NIB25720.1 glutathione S-transferase family protein [Pseudoteredinibacter isoporae]